MMDEGRECEAIIPEEDFREAIAACCEDPQLKRYFRLAPPGAKLFIGLGFYSTHFGDKADPRQYAECQAEIEPALTVNDLKYLIRFEDDKGTKSYLRRLLAQREEAHGAPSAEERPSSRASVDLLPVPRRHFRRKGSVVRLQWIMRKDAIRWFPLVCRTAALVCVLLGGAVFVAANWGRIRGVRPETLPPPEAVPPLTAQQEAVATNGATASEPVAAPSILTEPPPAVAVDEPAPGPAAPATQVAEASAPLPAAEPEVEASPALQDTAAEPSPTSARRRRRIARVVFTDGRRIVRHPGGKVEVPRVFSCAGAGIKPFWVYGPDPEVEAEKERKARREWKVLVEQAQAGSE